MTDVTGIVTGIVIRTESMVTVKKAVARSSSRKRVSRYSDRVSTHRPAIATRASSVSVVPSSSPEIGPAKGISKTAARVPAQKSEANDVATTFPGTSSVL